MSFIKLRFPIGREKADDLSTVLEALGALSVTWENAGSGDYLEAAYPLEPDWRDVYVTGLFHGGCQAQDIVQQVNDLLGIERAPTIERLEDQDWERTSLTGFKPRQYGDSIWICPSWVEPPDPDATNIALDPGLAFGTGDHTTTALCLEWISGQELTDHTVIDYGCGSGILAIACLLKGAAHAYGVDIDPRAVSASRANAEMNGVADRYDAIRPGGLPQDLEVDIVFANILAQVLIEQSEVLIHATRSGGRILLTGVLADQVSGVRKQFEPYFRFEIRNQDQWSLLVGNKT